MPRRLVVVLAVATGVAVASNYYAQPLLPLIRQSFGVSAATAGLVVTASQIGYACGLVFLMPLGDLVERRRLVIVMSLVTAAALAGAAAAPSLAVLFVAVAVVGSTSVVAQVLVTFSASLAGDHERGKIVGTVMSGLLIGILLARTVAGYIAQASSWRVVFLVASGMMVLLAVAARLALPRYRETTDLSYPAILASVGRIFRTEPVLRRRSLYGGLSFAAFAVLWTSVAFLLAGAPYHYGSGTIGLFGLVGASGAAMAQLAGRLADRGHQWGLTLVTAFAIVAGFVLLGVFPDTLGALIAGIVVLDLGCQGIHITNQSKIYALAPQARSRINAAYMTCYLTGGTLGSVGSALCYGAFGWSGVAGLGAGFGAAALLLALTERRPESRAVEPALAGVAPG
jgi:predicted MFS family arabinose efflux permease